MNNVQASATSEFNADASLIQGLGRAYQSSLARLLLAHAGALF